MYVGGGLGLDEPRVGSLELVGVHPEVRAEHAHAVYLHADRGGLPQITPVTPPEDGTREA